MTTAAPSFRLDLRWAAAAAALAMAVTIWACGGADMLSGRPLTFRGDAVFHYAVAKTAVDDPWTWHASRLGAPFGFPLAGFGEMLTVETALMKLVALTTTDAVAVLNRTWLLLIGLAAVNAFAGFRLLGLPRPAAFVCGCLFAASPHAFFRTITHFNLHAAFAPVPVALAVLVASGGIPLLRRSTFTAACVACGIAGLGYVYQPFFLALLITAAITIAVMTGRRGAAPRGLACLAVLLAAAAVNITPTIASWAGAGRPATLDYKRPEEADMFALRIRDLIVPSSASLIPPLAALGRHVERIDWPFPNESRLSKLGLVAAAGFLACLAVLVGWRPPVDDDLLPVVRAAASLVLVLVVVGVSGGFGSLFNAVISPQIRCYNRVGILIAFLSLVPVGGCLSQLLASCTKRPVAHAAAWAALLALGVVDQNVAAATRSRAAETRQERAAVESFVHALEDELPDDATVFMLPIASFPEDNGSGSMLTYDHAKPYLFSRRARWSWPPFGRRQEALVADLGEPGTPGFVDRIRAAGFGHAWLDRGAAPDRVATIETALRAAGATPLLDDDRGRYRVYRLGDAAAGNGEAAP